jgi:dihydrofolate synthase/folylpolyglutamate synthase
VTDPFGYLFGLAQVGIKFGLDNITAIVEALGRPDRAYHTIHVAGTNGKGSVTAMVDLALTAAGYRSARYTSPHLVDLTERFAIDGRAVDRDELGDAISHVRRVIEHLLAAGHLEAQPTFFEVTTAAAFEIFRRRQVDIAVVEVGLGGRLDATNVITPLVSAITSIGLDHQEYLGSTIEAIAYEKAGIAKPGVPLIVGPVSAGARQVIEETVAARGATTLAAADGVHLERLGEQRIRLRTPAHDYGVLELGLAGDHQVDNALVAVRLLEQLEGHGVHVAPAAVARGLSAVVWPGRLDLRRLPDGREVLLDAAHNEDGARALAAFLGTGAAALLPIVFAAMRDKDAAAMLRALVPHASLLVVTKTSNPRSADPLDLIAVARAIAPGVPLEIAAHPAEALDIAWRRGPRIVVAGSIFLLGDVLQAIGS